MVTFLVSWSLDEDAERFWDVYAYFLDDEQQVVQPMPGVALGVVPDFPDEAAFTEHIRGIKWDYPEFVQLLVRHSDEEDFRMEYPANETPTPMFLCINCLNGRAR